MLQLLPTVIIAVWSHAHHNHLAKACLRQFSCSQVSTLTRKLISLPAAKIWHCSYLSPKIVIFAGGVLLPAIIMSSGLPVWSRVTDVIETQRQRCKYNQFEKTMQCKNSKHCPSLSRGHFKCNQFHKRSQEPRDTLRLLGGRVHSRGHGVGHSS